MAAKMFFVILALVVLTAFVMASEEEDDFGNDALFEMMKRGRKGRKNRKSQYFNCLDEYQNDCICDANKGGAAVTC